MSNRDNVIIDVRNVKESGKNGIEIFIPRTNKSREGIQGILSTLSYAFDMYKSLLL